MTPYRLLLLTGLILFTLLYAAHFRLDRWALLTQIRLIVPRAQVNAPVTEFYLGAESWEITPWENRVGHFQGTTGLTVPGNMVLGGHVEYPDGSAGVFHDLNQVRVGDSIQLITGYTVRRYRVTAQQRVNASDLSVLYPTNDEQLTLITCDEASFDPDDQIYRERLVIIAKREEN